MEKLFTRNATSLNWLYESKPSLLGCERWRPTSARTRRRSASGRECQYSPKVVHRNAHSHARANLDYLLADHDI